MGSSNPPIMRSVVVLPQPDGPSSEKNSPSPIARSTRSTALTTPRREWKRLAIPTSWIAAAESSDAAPVEIWSDLVRCGVSGIRLLGGAEDPFRDKFRDNLSILTRPVHVGQGV